MSNLIEITEAPTRHGDEIFTARRDAADHQRYQVFGQSGMSPVGYLVQHYCDKGCPTDYKGRGAANERRIRVLNHRGEWLSCVSTYHNALNDLTVCVGAHNYTSDPTLNDAEKKHAAAGWCVWQTEYGTGRPPQYCDQPRTPEDLYHCPEHREEGRRNTGEVFDRF